MRREWRRPSMLLGLTALTIVGVATAGPAAAMPLRDRAAGAAVAVTTGSLRLVGDSFVGGTQAQEYTTAAGFAFTISQTGAALHVFVVGVNLLWSVDLKAPDGADLAVGPYVDAMRAAFAPPGTPGLDVSGGGSGCNALRGEFRVHRITIDVSHQVQALDVSFVQHCAEGYAEMLRGRLVVNLDPMAPLSEPGTYVQSGGDPPAHGNYSFSSGGGDVVLAQSERAGNTIVVVAARLPDSPGQKWGLILRAPSVALLSAGTVYAGTTQFGSSDRAQLLLTSQPMRFCNDEAGAFAINRLHVAEDGSIDLLDLLFRRTCDAIFPAIGRVLINATAPPLTASMTVTNANSVLGPKGVQTTIRGNVTCTDSAWYAVTGSVSQVVNGVSVSRPFTGTIGCTPGSTPWSITLPRANSPRFRSGAATVELSGTPEFATIYSPVPGPVSVSATVTLAATDQPLPSRRPVPHPLGP